MIRRYEFSLTTDSSGAGTVTAKQPINGLVEEVRNDGTAFASTAIYSITRGDGGGTVFRAGTLTAPWQYAPRQPVHTNAGVAVTYDGTRAVNDKIPVDGYLTMTVTQGGSVNLGTVSVYVSGGY